MLDTLPPPGPAYALGHAAGEFDRLIDQARFLGDLTEPVLRAAGVGPGMRVLDAGCGAGDVSFLAARLVGPAGEVVGVDRAPEAVALASRRAADAGLANVRFLVADLAEAVPEAVGPVDAVVGRLVLMYLADPAVVVRRLAGLVRPGGVVAFHEFDVDGATSEPFCAVFAAAVERIRQTLTRAGADTRVGLKLGRIFEDAGLPSPRMILGARVERGADSPLYGQVAEVTRSLLPLMERTGVATAAEVGVETLAARIGVEAAALDATLVSPAFVGAWARVGMTEHASA